MVWITTSNTERTANQPHKCWMCDRDVNPGDRYVRRNIVQPGRGRRSLAIHRECLAYAIGNDWDDLDWQTNDPQVIAAMVPLGVSSKPDTV